jgi:hypothetical protein
LRRPCYDLLNIRECFRQVLRRKLVAVPTSYLTSAKNLDGILAALKKAGVPGKFSYDFLKQLGFPSSNDRPLVPVLKAMRFVEDSGVPLDRYKRFRDESQSKAVMAEGLRDAYSDVFAINQQPHGMSAEELKGVFARLSGKSDAVAEKMALTFKALSRHADFTAVPSADGAFPATRDLPAMDENGDEPPALRLHHDVHVHLPASTDVAVYDAIFRALRQNLGSK